MAFRAPKSMANRLMVIKITAIVLLMGIAVSRLFYIVFLKEAQVSATSQPKSLEQLALEQQLSDVTIPAPRGNIYDKNMMELANSTTVWTVGVTPASINDSGLTTEEKEAQKELVSTGLSEILSVDKNKIMGLLNKNSAYEEIKEGVEIEEANAVREFAKINSLNNIIQVDDATKRNYPNGNLASTVLGFVGKDNQGLYGLEYYYDDQLKGTDGRIVSSKDSKGRNMPFSAEQREDAVAGNSLVLTIDSTLQFYAENALDQAVKDNKVNNRGCIIAMDVNTGEILAMSSKPDFDPNNYQALNEADQAKVDAAASEEEADKLRSELQQNQWMNKAVSYTYDPGSVYKIVTGAAALEENIVTPEQSFYCNGEVDIEDRTYHCVEPHGTQNLGDVFANSCNVSFIGMGQTLGAEKFTKYRKAFGIEEKTGIDLPNESNSIVHKAETLSRVELASESFGQTLKVTPIQMITAVAAATNGGYLMKPHIVSQVIDSEGNIVKSVDPVVKRQVISNETSDLINELLAGVVTPEGTGRNAVIPGYKIGGKTGTSEKPDTANVNGRKPYVASFTAVAPAEDPEIAVILMLDEPMGQSYYGGTIAAPAVASFLTDALPYMGVQAQYTPEELAAMDKTTPSVVGKNLKDAKSEITKANLKYKVIGNNTSDDAVILGQMPTSIQTIPAGGTVMLYTTDEAPKLDVTLPSFAGLTVSQVNTLAAETGLNVSLKGSSLTSAGVVAQSQSIPAGQKVQAGTTVTVTFIQEVKDETH